MYTSGVCPAAIRAFNFPSYSSRFVVIGVTWYFPSYSVLKRSITSLYPLETRSSVASRSSQNIHVISSVSSAYAGTATAMVPATIAAESNTESNLFLFIFLILLLIHYLVSWWFYYIRMSCDWLHNSCHVTINSCYLSSTIFFNMSILIDFYILFCVFWHMFLLFQFFQCYILPFTHVFDTLYTQTLKSNICYQKQ